MEGQPAVIGTRRRLTDFRADARTTHVRTASDVRLELARPEDDAELRRLLRDNPMQGEVSVSLEREPSFFAGALDGERHRTIVGRWQGLPELAGMGSLASRRCYVNGEAVWQPYLGCLRVDRRYRRALRLLRDGFEMCRGLLEDDELPFCLTSIISDNREANKLLAGGRAGLPSYRPIEEMETIVLPAGRTAPHDSQGVDRGSMDALPEIIELIDSRAMEHQFAEQWAVQDILSDSRTPGLEAGDFFVRSARGRIVAALALWDQRAVKQAVVRGYGPTVGRLRHLINLLAPVFGIPRLPRVGETIAMAYLSHIAAEDDRPEHVLPLVRAARREARSRGLTSLAVGLSVRSPLAAAIKAAFRHRIYPSTLYAVHWSDDASIEAVDRLDGRLCRPEVALL